MPRKIKIGLSWHNLNSTNYGVGALGVAHIALVKQAAKIAEVEVSFETIGSKENSSLGVRREVEELYGQKIPHTNFSLRKLAGDAKRLRFPLVKKFRDFDLVLDIGEGDSFSDIYGKKRFTAHFLAKLFVLRAGVRLMLCPQTIGPFTSSIVSKSAAFVMKRSIAVWARDNQSADFARELGVDVKETTDVAFALPFEQSPVDADAVGLNVSGLLLSGGYSGDNQFGLAMDYTDFCHGFIKAFIERGKTVHLVAHVVTDSDEIEDDYRACLALKEHYKDDDRVVVAPRFTSPVKAKSYISGMSFFAGSRMHATIASFSSGVPTVPVAYSRKFDGVFGGLGYFYTVDACSENAEEALTKIVRLFDNNLDELRASLAKSKQLAEERNTAYMHALASELARG